MERGSEAHIIHRIFTTNQLEPNGAEPIRGLVHVQNEAERTAALDSRNLTRAHSAPVMPTVAEQLRQAREARNLSHEQVAEIMKIRTDHLKALEGGDFSVFAAPVYIRGFVRTYAKLLKLDVAQVMAALDNEMGKDNKFPETRSLPEGKRTIADEAMLLLSKVDWRRGLIAVGAAVVLVAVIAWLAGRRHKPIEPAKAPRVTVTNRVPQGVPVLPRKH